MCGEFGERGGKIREKGQCRRLLVRSLIISFAHMGCGLRHGESYERVDYFVHLLSDIFVIYRVHTMPEARCMYILFDIPNFCKCILQDNFQTRSSSTKSTASFSSTLSSMLNISVSPFVIYLSFW